MSGVPPSAFVSAQTVGTFDMNAKHSAFFSYFVGESLSICSGAS